MLMIISPPPGVFIRGKNPRHPTSDAMRYGTGRPNRV